MENYGIEVNLLKDFNVVRELLSRIGVANKLEKKLYPSCNILHKQGKYYIVHFKEMFALDGRNTNISEKDLKRRDSVVYLLHKWGLVDPLVADIQSLQTNEFFSVLKKEQKDIEKWTIVPKYKIGKDRNN